MSRSLHAILNRVLPLELRRKLRDAATATIPTMRHLDMPVRMRHLASLGFEPDVIYDIGAAGGVWARDAHKIWPHARIVGFEPNQTRVPELERTSAALPVFSFHRCFLGAASGQIEYVDRRHETTLFDPAPQNGPRASAPMLVLDELIASGQIPPPNFMKLDVQGYELEVLKGGQRALELAQAALLEVNVYHLTPGMPTVMDVLEFMRARGYFWYDVLGLLRRKADDAMAHLDFMFLREGHPLLRDSWE